MGISPTHSIDRSRVNETSVRVASLPKSGFNKSYKSYSEYSLGKLHVSGYHHCMPADKFRGKNDASLTFFRLTQPNISDVNIGQYNFFITLRSLDTTFENAFAPNLQNSMSANWSAPSFSLQQVVKTLHSYFSATYASAITSTLTAMNLSPSSALSSSDLTVLQNVLINSNFYQQLKSDFSDHYLLDWLDNVYIPRMTVLINSLSTSTTNIEAFQIFFDALYMPFIGEDSLLDELGYIFVRRSDLLSIRTPPSNLNDVEDLVSQVDQNEYALRAYYVVWYEYFRDNNLEPRRSTLTDWHNFGSTSVVNQHLSFLAIRFRSWTKDVFTTSMPDDIMRHVFAPVLDSNLGGTQSIGADYSTSTDFVNAESSRVQSTLQRNIGTYQLTYRDPISNTDVSINCPLPRQVNDVLKGSLTSKNVANLDLFSLRNAQSLERYLKRNFYFGDEYRDRMAAHYGSYVSDLRVNRPEFLSSSVSPINPSQVVSSAGSDTTPQGERNMTVTASTSSDDYNFFAEEFGIVLNFLTIMPVAQYNGVCPQNMLSSVTDYPIPEFAANNEEFSRVYEISFSGLNSNSERVKPTFGHHPYAHSWRSRVNEVHKGYLSSLQNYTFRRLFGMDDDGRVPLLNYEFIHCKPNLGMFEAGHDQLYEHQVYGFVNHQFYVESVLPTPVEVI